MKIKHILLSASTALATLSVAAPAAAQADPFIGQMATFPYTFCPRGWADANGQLLAISQNQALFSLYGTTFGGDGRTSFGLPDMRGRVMMGTGSGPGLTPRTQGQKFGSQENYITVPQMPAHTHRAAIRTLGEPPNDTDARGAAFTDQATDTYHDGISPTQRYMDLGTVVVENTGGNQPVNNIQPTVVLRNCVALTGLYPSRN